MAEQAKPKAKKSCLSCLVFMVVAVAGTIALIAWVASLPDPGAGNLTRPVTLMDGDEAVLRMKPGQPRDAPILCGASPEAYDAAVSMIAAGDHLGLEELIADGLLAYFPQGTPVQITDRGFMKTRFRVTGGEFVDQSAWTATEFVREP